jgi:hypothetical protein
MVRRNGAATHWPLVCHARTAGRPPLRYDGFGTAPREADWVMGTRDGTGHVTLVSHVLAAQPRDPADPHP